MHRMKTGLTPTVKILQAPIDEFHKNVLWYGDRVAEVEYKGFTFILGAYGDVNATLLAENGYDPLVWVKDKRNSGAFYSEMSPYIKNDDMLRAFEDTGRLVLENNNWFEVLVDDPYGEQYDTGWVTNSDNYDAALQEVIRNMDDFIKSLCSDESFLSHYSDFIGEKFKSGQDMLEFLYNDGDLYMPLLGMYVFHCNEDGAVCVYYNIPMPKALELEQKSREDDGEYWGAYLGVGGYIYDNPLEFCNEYFSEKWIATNKIMPRKETT